MEKTTMSEGLSAVSKRRLLKLAAFLRTLPRKQFDYSWWVTEVGEKLQKTGRPEIGCGTVACALGWAPAVIRNIKLRIVPESTFGTGRFLSFEFSVDGEDCPTALCAAKMAFQITGKQAEFLFTASDYNWALKNATPKQVAARIERFVKQEGAID